MLADLTGSRKTIAVAGTHGKTTTTAMIATRARARRASNRRSRSAACASTPARTPDRRSGAWFVTESDESDGSFLHLQPTIAVVTNVENDHLSSDDELPRLLEQFATFVQRVPPDGRAIVGIDNRGSALHRRQRGRSRRTTFATARGRRSARRATSSTTGSARASRWSNAAIVLGEVRLHVPGEINVAERVGRDRGGARSSRSTFATIAGALEAFHGVRRRFEIVGESAGLTVVDDYAHHPTAVAQTIAAARGYTGKPVIVAFQPHRYSRTRYLAADFAAALSTRRRGVSGTDLRGIGSRRSRA